MPRGKSVVVCALLITLLFTLPTGGVALSHVSLKINDELVELRYPLITEGERTFVSLDDIVRVLNLTTHYEEGSKVTLGDNHGSTTLDLSVASDVLVYVPLRLVAESFGFRVNWVPRTRTILLTENTAISLESPVEYTIVNRVDMQKDSMLSSWFDRHHRNRGAFFMTIDDDTYVLVSAGPKPTGGYGLKLENVALAGPNSLLVSVNLTTPKPGAMVTMAFTYPNIVLRFSNQSFDEVDMVLHEAEQPSDLIQPKLGIKE